MQPATKIRIENNLALAALALVFLVMAVQRFPGERWWPTALLVYTPQLIWTVPPVILGIYFLVRRRWELAAGSVIVIGIVLTVLVGAAPPWGGESGRANLRVLTWNINYGRGGPYVAELARNTWPDVICLQQTEPWVHDGLPELLDLPLFEGWSAETCGEFVTLSRFPMKRLGTTHSVLWVSVNVDGRNIVVGNAHLDRPYTPRRLRTLTPAGIHEAERLRMRQIQEILDFLPEYDPAIVCGDFNTPPNTRIYRALTSSLQDAFRKAGRGLGLSYQRQRPVVRIDHIFVSNNITPVRCWMPEIDASNHRPVCADIAL